MGSEYRSYISLFSTSHRLWATEATARRNYDTDYGCGLDGCQNDELYMFLSTYQAPRNFTLDETQFEQIDEIRRLAAIPGNSYYVTEVSNLNEAVNAILNPPSGSDNWLAGVITNQPYGWGTRRDIVLEADAIILQQRYSYCNEERFAYYFFVATSGDYDIFFGVTESSQNNVTSPPSGVDPITCSYLP